MGNCMNSKQSNTVTDPQKVNLMKNQVHPIQSSSQPISQQVDASRTINIEPSAEKNMSFDQIRAEIKNIEPDQSKLKEQEEVVVPKKQLSKIQQMKLQKKKEQQMQKQQESHQALFELLIELAQQSEPQEVDINSISSHIKDDAQVSKCILEKEYSGLTIIDYCMQNQHIYLLRFLVERVNLEIIGEKEEELAQITFKALISASKQFNRTPKFFFDFLDLIQSSESLQQLFSIYLESANPSCFLQFINLESDQAQLFLERIKELIQTSIENTGKQKEIELLSAVIKIQHSFLLKQYFVKLIIPEDEEILKQNLNQGDLKIEFDDRTFDLTQSKSETMNSSLKKYYYNFAHHLAQIKRLDLIQNKWDIYLPQLLEKDSSRNSGASLILLKSDYTTINDMINAIITNEHHYSDFIKISNASGQNLIHHLISNNNLNSDQTLTLLKIIFQNKQHEKQELLKSYDNLQNIPLTLYLKKQTTAKKDLVLIEQLTPEELKGKQDNQSHYPLLSNLEFPIWEFQYLSLFTIPHYIWRSNPKLSIYCDTIEALNNQIIISLLSLSNQRKEVLDIVGNKLCFALIKDGYEKYLLKQENQLAERCLVQQEQLDESSHASQNEGNETKFLSYLKEQNNFSNKGFYTRFIQLIEKNRISPASALDLVLTAKLKQEFNLIRLDEKIINSQFETIFKKYENKSEYFNKLTAARVFQIDQNYPYFTFCKIAALKDEKYYKVIENKIDLTNITEDEDILRVQIILLNAFRLEHLVSFSKDNKLIRNYDPIISIMKSRVKQFRNFKGLLSFIVEVKKIYPKFQNSLSPKMKKKLYTIICEQLFNKETDLKFIKSFTPFVLKNITSGKSFKKVLQNKGISSINEGVGFSLKAFFETVPIKEKSQWDYLKNCIEAQDLHINLRQEYDIKYYQNNSKKIIYGLIHCDVLNRSKILVPFNTPEFEPIVQLKTQLLTGNSPYLHLFYDLITTEQNIFEILFAKEEYLEILTQITSANKDILYVMRYYVSIAIKNDNLPVLKWLLTTIYPSDQIQEEETNLQFNDLKVRSYYPSYNEVSKQCKNLTNNEITAKKETQWEIFNLIYTRYKKDINTGYENSWDIIKLYEHFGLKFAPFKIQYEPNTLTHDYLHLTMVVREIYQKHGERALKSNRVLSQYKLDDVQVQIIIENLFKKIVSWYDELDELYYSQSEKDPLNTAQLYHLRTKIITALDFVQKKLFSQVRDNENVQEALLELSKRALNFNDQDLFVLVSRMFCEIVRNEADNFQCATSFIDQVVYPYFLSEVIQCEKKDSIPPPDQSLLEEKHEELQKQSENYGQALPKVAMKATKAKKGVRMDCNKAKIENLSKIILSKVYITKLYKTLNSLILSALASKNEELIVRLVRVVALISYQSKSDVSFLFNILNQKTTELLDYGYLFQQSCPLFFNRYLNDQRFEQVIKTFSEQKSYKFTREKLTEESNLRLTFIIHNLLKDTARFGQFEKWRIVNNNFSAEFTKTSEMEVIMSCLYAYAGRLSIAQSEQNMSQKEKFSYSQVYTQIQTHMVNWLKVGGHVPQNQAKQPSQEDFSKIITGCLKLLSTNYSKQQTPLSLKKMEFTVNDKHFSDLSLEVILNLLNLSLLLKFEDTLTMVKHIHHRVFQNSKDSSIEEDQDDYNVNEDEQEHNKQLWGKFIVKSIQFGALSTSSIWTSDQLKRFLEEFGKDYIEAITSKPENDKKIDTDILRGANVINLEKADFKGICHIQSTDSQVNQEYLSFLIKNKDQFSPLNKVVIQFILDVACRRSTSAVTTRDGSEKNYCRKYILDAMKEFGVKFILMLKIEKYSSLSFKRITLNTLNLDFSQGVSIDVKFNNCLAEYMILLSEDELEHALSQKLFSLQDDASPKMIYRKLQFLEYHSDKETESMDYGLLDMQAIRYALILGKINFVKNHEEALLETVILNSMITNKVGRCAQISLYSGRLECFLHFFDKIPKKEEQYDFLSSQRLLFAMAESFIGNQEIFKYLTTHFYCNESVNKQCSQNSQLLYVGDLVEGNCKMLKHLAIMKQEEALLDIFEYAIKHFSEKDIKRLSEEMNKKTSTNPIEQEETNMVSSFDTFQIYQLYQLQCFLFENGFKNTNQDFETDDSVFKIFNCNFSKFHQSEFLEKQGVIKSTKSRSPLYTHLTIILKFLLGELTQYQVNFSSLQKVEDMIFSMQYPKRCLSIIYTCLGYFATIQFTSGIYILCEIFKCINYQDLMAIKYQKRIEIQRSELFNIYLLQHGVFPDIDIIKIIEGNQQYFKHCRMAKCISKINSDNIQPSVEFLHQIYTTQIPEFGQNKQLLVGEEKNKVLKDLIYKYYYQKVFIVVILERFQEFFIYEQSLINDILLQDATLPIYLLKEDPLFEMRVEQFEKDINDNQDQFQIMQEDEFKKQQFKTLFSAKAAAESQKQFSDSPFNKVLRSIVYYFAVQKGESILEIYNKVFKNINVFSKQGISYQYHLQIIKNAPQRAITGSILNQENQTSQGKEEKANISIEQIQDLIENVIYKQLIKVQENYNYHQINIEFNSFFKDISQFINSEGISYEKQYALVFQTVFRFFQMVYSLYLIDNYPEKKLSIHLQQGADPIKITHIDDNGLQINLYYSYSGAQFQLNAQNIEPLVNQVEDFYFKQTNMPFIEQQIELFNNHKDRIIRQSQFGVIPFTFNYSNFESLTLSQKKEVLNQVQLRSQETLKSEFKKQTSQNNSSAEKKEQYFDSNSYFGLYSLVEDISMFLSLLNIRQKEFYALNDMFAPHNNAMMNPIETQHGGQQQQTVDGEQRHASQTMISSQTMNLNSRIGGGVTNQTRDGQNVLNSIKMQGAIFSYYLEQLPDNTYQVNLKKNNSISKSPSNQLLFSEFYEFCPFKEGDIQIIYIGIEEYKQKTQTQSIYNTLLGQVISYEQHFLCALKTVEDHQNLDCSWYYSIENDKDGNNRIVYKKELFAGYNLLRLKQMMNDLENEISFGKREEISQKWKVNVQSLLEVVVSGLFNIAQGSSAYDCERCSVDRDSVFSLIQYILSSPLLKKIIHIILYQNFSDSGNIMKVIKGIYFEFNEIEVNELPEESKYPELDQYLDYGFDQMIRIGKTDYYIHKFMLVIRINLCFIKNDLKLVQLNQNKNISAEDLILKEIPILKNYIQIITNQYDFYEQIFTPQQIVSFILNKLEIDNHLLSLSKKLSKKFSQSQTIGFNLNYESLYHIFNTDLVKAKMTKDPIQKIQKYDKIWRGLDNLKNYLLDSLEKNLQQQLEKESYQEQFFMILQNLIHSYENKQFIKKRLSSNYRDFTILKRQEQVSKQTKQTTTDEEDEEIEIEDEFEDQDFEEDANGSSNSTTQRSSSLMQCISKIRSGHQYDSLKNSFLIQVSISDFLLLAKKGDLCFVGYYLQNKQGGTDYHQMMAKIVEKNDKQFIFDGEYRNSEVPKENIKFALMSFQNWPNPQIFAGSIQKYCIIDSSFNIQLINSKVLQDICEFFMSEESQNNQELSEGYLYRGGDTLSSEISLNSLIQLMPSHISFVFEANIDKQNDNQFDLLNLKKQQSSIVRNTYDIFDNNNKQIVFKFDELYKFKKPQLNPDQFSFASSVDSNSHIQEEFTNLIEKFKNLLSCILLQESDSQELKIEFEYDAELEAQREIHVEQIEMNISFICYNILDTFNQYLNGSVLSPEFLKQLYLLTYHDAQTRKEFFNESDIIQYLLVKLFLKHIQNITLKFQYLHETAKNSENLPLAEYNESSKCFTIFVHFGQKQDDIIIPSTLDISYNLLRQLVNCEYKYLFQERYLQNKANINNPNQSFLINSDLYNYKLKFQNDLKSFNNLSKVEYEALLVFLVTFSFQIKTISLLCSLQSFDYNSLSIQFTDKKSSSFQLSPKKNKIVEILLGYGSTNSILDFVDFISLLNSQKSESLNVALTRNCYMEVDSFLKVTDSSNLIITQGVNSLYSNEEQNTQITTQSNYEVKMVDISNFNHVTTFNVELASLFNNVVQLSLQETLSHLQGDGNHYLYVVYYKKHAISYNYFLKNTDDFLQQLLKQPKEPNYKINQYSHVLIQTKEFKTSTSLFDGFTISFSQSNDDNQITHSSYSSRYQEIFKNNKMRLTKILEDHTSHVSFFTFEINSRFISKDIMLLTLKNSKAFTLNILNSKAATIVLNDQYPVEQKDIKIQYSSTSKIVFNKTQITGCIIDDQPLQLYKSNKSKQDKDNQKKISALFKIFKPKTVTKLTESLDDLEYIESENDLKKFKDIQRQIFMEDGRQSVYSRAGQVRKDVINFYDGYGNVMQPSETLSNYNVTLVHILYSQIKFKGQLKLETDKKEKKNILCCEWKPLIKGSYRMYINGTYVPQSDQVIGVLSNQVDPNNIKIESSDQELISYYDVLDCQVFYKDIYGNNFSEFDRSTFNDPKLFEVRCQAQISNLEFSFSVGQIDKAGKQKVNLRFDSAPNGVLNQANKCAVTFHYKDQILGDKQLHSFNIVVQGMNFEKRKKQFHDSITKFRKNMGGQTVKINRERFAEELLTNFETFDLKNALYVQFKDEKGIDAGGVKREFYELIGKMMKDSTYQFFELSESQSTEKYFFHPSCLKMKQSVNYFKIFGKLIAHTILHDALLGIEFCEPMYKLITKQDIQFEDLRHVLDAQTYNNYNFLKGLDDESLGDLSLYFTFNQKGKVVDITPNGRNIQVTKQNLDEYLLSTAQYYLQNRFALAITNLQEGFESVFPSELLLKFIHPNELPIFTCGLKDIDAAFLQKLTTFHGGNSILQSYYYRYLSECTSEMLHNYLKFITGSSSIPFDYSSFKLVIDFMGSLNVNKLPLSHTCFRSIEVPYYKSYEQMKSKFDLAFTLGSEGFAFG